jgi:hypothetical protein
VLSPSLRRETLAVRANALSISLAQPNGAEFELARWRADHGEWDRAIATLQPLAKDPKSAFHSEAERLARRARLERALSWIDVAAARRDEKGAAREFESLASDGKDFTAVAARIARAALALKQSKQDEARRWMREGLEAWRKNQQSDPAAAKGSLEEDVTAIRNLVIRRLDDAGPYLLATSVTPVRFAAGNTAAVVLSRPLPQLPNALFLNEEREMFLVTLMKRFGVDPEKNSPPIDAEEQKEFPDRLPAFMQKFFPITIGPFSQWVFFTSAITQIEFTDEQGANATVFMTYDKLAQFRFRPGMGTLAQKLQDIHLEKRNGVWRVIETRSWQEGEGG